MRYGGAEVGGVGKTYSTIGIGNERFDDKNKAPNNPISKYIKDLPNIINGSIVANNSMKVTNDSNSSSAYNQ